MTELLPNERLLALIMDYPRSIRKLTSLMLRGVPDDIAEYKRKPIYRRAWWSLALAFDAIGERIAIRRRLKKKERRGRVEARPSDRRKP